MSAVADVAQLVEHAFRKREVMGSSPIIGSKFPSGNFSFNEIVQQVRLLEAIVLYLLMFSDMKDAHVVTLTVTARLASKFFVIHNVCILV